LGRYILKGISAPRRFQPVICMAARNWGDDSRGGRDSYQQDRRGGDRSRGGYQGVKE